LFLGVEGGATRTVAILADASGTVVQRIEAGPANVKLLSDPELISHFRSLARPLPQPAAICIGLAGLRDERDRARVLAAAGRIWPMIPCQATADLETALAAAGPPRTGSIRGQVLVLSGTGSCCFGRTLRGKTAKVGGWGHLLGDKGSAYEIGLRALKALVYYSDRDGRWPRLGSRLLRSLQLNTPEDLVTWVQSAAKKEIASLALEVFDAWNGQDKIASDILAGAAASLAKDAVACARRLVSTGPVQFIFSGSVLLKQPRFAKLVAKELRGRWPEADILTLSAEGAWGAARLAHKLWISGNRVSGGAEAGQGRSAVSRSKRTHLSEVPAGGTRKGDSAIPIPEWTAMPPTERRNPRSSRLDRMSLRSAVRLMLSEEAKVPGILLAEDRQIGRCVALIARALKRGGRLFYVGAGTSGRLGALDASECPPTFRASPDQVQGVIAGGREALWQSIEGAEDDVEAGAEAIRFRGVGAKDVVVGIAASGRTPFVWGALHQAKANRARTILISFNPYLKIARQEKPDLIIAADLGPEVLTGSTRLKAGTGTKLLLNILSTLSMVRLGKAVSNLMVDLNPSNQKLRGRAVRIVRELTRASETDATQALEKSAWVVKQALKLL
jgi:N-acetylmuramic acid 6-phosphate etherase